MAHFSESQRNKQCNYLLFLMGAFSLTEASFGAGFLAISEMVVFMVAPFVFLKDFRSLKHDGFMPMVWLIWLTMAGCIVASYVNHTPLQYFCRGFFAVYAVFAGMVCFHRLLSGNFSGVKYFFFGVALSCIINIFIFQRGSARHGDDVALVSAAAMESTLGSVLFWGSRLQHWLYLPIKGWYLSTPKVYSVAAPFVVAAVSLLGSGGSGRSFALCAIASSVLLILGSKKVSILLRLKRKLIVVFIVMLIGAFAAKGMYSHLAKSGALGEVGLRKYEQQTKSGTGVLPILMAGRSEFFAGIYCAVHNPIVGYGPWAIDWDDLYYGFLEKYGTIEDFQLYVKCQLASARDGGGRVHVIPSHSCIVGFWTWYGIFGLVLWLYIFWLYYKTMTAYFVNIPLWYGCFATIIPLAVWDGLFSPFGARLANALLFTMCLYAKAVYQHRVAYCPEEGE